MLEFKRTSRFNTENLGTKFRKDWISVKPTRYHITWRSMACGVHVSPGFRVTFLCYTPGNFPGGRSEIWTFVDLEKRVFKTMKKAVEVCNQHSQSWDKAVQCPSMRALKSLFDGRRPSDIPVWVYNHLDRNILSVLMDNNVRKTREEEDDIEYFETDFIPEPEPEVKAEKKVKKKTRSKKPVSGLSVVLPTKRKQRADKGKARKKIDKVPEFNYHTPGLDTGSFENLKKLNSSKLTGEEMAIRLDEFTPQVVPEVRENLEQLGKELGARIKKAVKRGRSTDSKTKVRKFDPATSIDAQHGFGEPQPTKRRGRPKGSKNKVKK
jgi:hypothetical protein